MWLKKVEENLRRNVYQTEVDMLDDLQRIVNNSKEFNTCPDSKVWGVSQICTVNLYYCTPSCKAWLFLPRSHNYTYTFLSIRIAKTDFSETFRPQGSSSVTNNWCPWQLNVSLKSVFATRMLKIGSVQFNIVAWASTTSQLYMLNKIMQLLATYILYFIFFKLSDLSLYTGPWRIHSWNWKR